MFSSAALRASETGTPHVHGPEILDVRRRYRSPEWLRNTMKRGSRRIMQLVGVLEGIHLHSRNVKLEDKRDSRTVFKQISTTGAIERSLVLSLFLVFLVFAQVGGCFPRASYLFLIYFLLRSSRTLRSRFRKSSVALIDALQSRVRRNHFIRYRDGKRLRGAFRVYLVNS